MCGEVPNGDPLLEHVPILHIDSQPHLEPVVFRDEVPQARTTGLAQAVEELREAGDVFVWSVALDEESMPEGTLCDRRRRRLGYCPFPFVMDATMPAVTVGGRVGHPPTQASEHREVYSMQRSSACGRNLRCRRHSQQIETSSSLVEEVSLAGTDTLAQL